MMRPRAWPARRLGLWALWLCASACSETKPLTQIVVVVDSDLDVPTELDSLQIEVSGALNMPSAIAALRGGDLPRSLGLVHAGGSLGPVRVSARGFLDDTHALVVERTASVRFVQDKTLQLRLVLARACAARVNEPCDDGETCDAGECLPEQIESLPEFSGKLPAHGPQAGRGAAAEGGGGDGGEAVSGTGGMDSAESGAGGSGRAGEPAQNSAPTCEITQPADHATFYLGDSVKLSGTCTDAESGTPSELVWSSSRQGTIGSTQSAEFKPDLGEHSISLCAIDAADSALSGCAPMIVIEVEALPSIGASIDSLKQAGSSTTPFFSDKDVVTAGSGTGVAPFKLSWSDSLLGSLGEAVTLTTRLPAGKHALALTVSDGRSRTASVVSGYFSVLDPGQTALIAKFDAINTALSVTGPAIALGADADNLFVVSSMGGDSETSTLYRLAVSNPMPATAGKTSVLTGAKMMGDIMTLRDVFAHPASQHAYLATRDGYVTCTTSPSGIDSNSCKYSKDAATNWVTGEINTLLRVVAPGNNKDYLVLGTPTGMAACDAIDCANSNQYLKNIAVSDLAIADDMLWIASANGLYSSDLTQSNGLSGAPPKPQKDTPTMLTAVAAGSSGVWLGSAAGLARFDVSTKVTSLWNMTTSVGPFQRLASNDVRALAIARASQGSGSQREVIWIATGAGVSRFDPSVPSFITLTTADGLPSNSVRSVLVLANGDKLFGTDAGIALYRGP